MRKDELKALRMVLLVLNEGYEELDYGKMLERIMKARDLVRDLINHEEIRIDTHNTIAEQGFYLNNNKLKLV